MVFPPENAELFERIVLFSLEMKRLIRQLPGKMFLRNGSGD